MAKRLYSLYEKVGGKWKRVSNSAYSKATAIRVYQDRLMSGFFDGVRLELRPIPRETRQPETPLLAHEVLCESCAKHVHDCARDGCACGCRLFSVMTHEVK